MPSLAKAVEKLGFKVPTPIQSQAIPALLSGRDVLGQAATGTGKTAAFGLPLLQRVLGDQEERRVSKASAPQSRPDALVLVPTRELAIQVAKALSSFAAGTALQVAAIYGGQDMRIQLRALKGGAQIVVATPGRLIDHLQRRSLHLDAVGMVVLDEADEMLDRGFADDLAEIFDRLPQERQTAMFSATLPARVAHMAQRALRQPKHIKVLQKARLADGELQITHLAYLVPPQQRAAALCRVLTVQDPQAALIFCRTRADVDTLFQTLSRNGHRCEALHGGMSQDARDKVMLRFRRKDFALLIATDVAARGLDIDHVSHVINYDLPENPEVYVHRVGRTGRAGRSGIALSFVKPMQRRFIMQIARHMNVVVNQEELPTASHLANLRGQRTLEAVKTAIEAAPVDRAAAFADHAAQLSEQFTPLQLATAALAMAQAASGEGAVEQSSADLGTKWSAKFDESSARPDKQRYRGRKFNAGGRSGPPRQHSYRS